MVVKYRGEDSEDVLTADELGFKDVTPDAITMGHPETGVTEKFTRVEGSVNEDVDRDEDEEEDILEGIHDDVDELIEEENEIDGEDSLRRRLDQLSWPQLQSVASEFEDVGGKKEDIINDLSEKPYGEVDSVIDEVAEDGEE